MSQITRQAVLGTLYAALNSNADNLRWSQPNDKLVACSQAVLNLARAIAILEGKPEPARVEAGAPTQRLPPLEWSAIVRGPDVPLDKP